MYYCSIFQLFFKFIPRYRSEKSATAHKTGNRQYDHKNGQCQKFSLPFILLNGSRLEKSYFSHFSSTEKKTSLGDSSGLVMLTRKSYFAPNLSCRISVRNE